MIELAIIIIMIFAYEVYIKRRQKRVERLMRSVHLLDSREGRADDVFFE